MLALGSLLSVPAAGQVKDAAGKPLAIGQPAGGSTRDFNGGTIAAGQEALCSVDSPAGSREKCVFYPRNGDGSFAIDVAGKAYYADRIDEQRMAIYYDNGARLVPLGQYVRDTSRADCWAQGEHRICARLAD